MTFPHFKFNRDNVPIGDSAKMCMGLTWVPLRQRSQYDKYMEVKGFDACDLYASGRAYWEEDYPTTGLNFKMWDQSQKKGDTTCTNGIYVESTDLCFTYKIMRQICVLLKFERNTETNTYSWVYTGGCFEGDKAVIYETAIPGETHNFQDIQFEARMDTRANAAIADAQAESGEFGEEVETDDSNTPTGRVRS